MSLLWWVFIANGSVLVVALLLLTFSPIEIDAPIEAGQFALLLAGFVVLLVLNLVLLRRVLSPLFRLTEVMSSVDPDRPGRRLSGVDPLSSEGHAMAEAFNAMLDRLESAQEGLTNAWRHSGADSVTVSLTADAETVTLRVDDDGKGMPTQLPHGTAGIAGMRERALLVGGRLSIRSRPEQGTELRLTIPVPQDGQ